MPLDEMHAALAEVLGGESQPQSGVPESPPSETTETTTPEVQAEQAENAASPEVPESTTQGAERARGPDGKFTKAQAQPQPPQAKAQAAQSGQKPAAPAQPANTEPAGAPAPRSWSPVAREHWNALPRPVKDEWLKRDGEFTRYRQQAEPALQEHRQLRQVLQPYMPHFQAAGVQPLQHIQGLLSTEYALRAGDNVSKAQMVARLIQQFGVPIDTLDKVLAGQHVEAPPQQAQQQFRDPRVDELEAERQRGRQLAAQYMQQRTQAAVDAFAADPANKYFEQVRDTMAALWAAHEWEVAQARNEGEEPPAPPTLADLYQQALTSPKHKGIMDAIRKEQAEEAKRAQQQKVQQARYVAGSVQSEPAPPAGKRKGLNGMFDALQQSLGGE